MPQTIRGRAQLSTSITAAYFIGAGLALGLMVGGGWLIVGYVFCGLGALFALAIVLDLLAP